jgi:hypothetical protein
MEAFDKTQLYGIDRLIGGDRTAANMGNAVPPVKSLPWNSAMRIRLKEVGERLKQEPQLRI